MKIAVIILGILGGLMAFALGATWVSDYHDNQSTIATHRMMVPARRRKALAAPHTCEASSRALGHR